jgi:hypothetical protein
MKLLKATKWANIEIDGRRCGQVIKAVIKDEKALYYLIYATYRNSSHVMKKKFPGCVGMSTAIIDKLEKLHNVSNIIIKYERHNGEFEYYMSKTNQWLDSDKERYDGLDKQKFLSFNDMKKIEVVCKL